MATVTTGHRIVTKLHVAGLHEGIAAVNDLKSDWEAFRECDHGIAEAIAGRGAEWPREPTN